MALSKKTFGEMFDFTRASPKWVFNSAGILVEVPVDIPAYDHDPVTGESLGVLIEESRTNLVPNSSSSGTGWRSHAATISDSAISTPPGYTPAIRVEDSNTNSDTHLISSWELVRLNENDQFTGTVLLKAGEKTTALFMIGAFRSHRCEVRVNLTTGTLYGWSDTGNAYDFVGSNIEALVDGWYKVTLTGRIRSGFNNVILLMEIHTTSNFSAVGVVGEGLYICAPQVEQASTASSYIPTTTAAVSRAADIIKTKEPV